MKWNRLIQLLLLLVAVKCNEACTKLLERQSTNAVSSTAVRDVTTIAERIVRQAAIQVVGEIAKPSAVETTKGVVRSVAKKSLEVARLAVVFGVVDGPGDAVRASAPGDKVSSEYLIILENQRALQVMQERQEQRKLKLQRIMKNLELRELEMCIPIKSRMVTEGLSAEKDGKPDTQSCTRKDMALDAAQLDSDEPEKEGLPRWAAFIAYFVGSFTAFLGFLIVYHCCKFSCKGTDDGNVYVHKWTPHTPRV